MWVTKENPIYLLGLIYYCNYIRGTKTNVADESPAGKSCAYYAARERVRYFIFRPSDAHKLRFPTPTRHFATPGRLTPYTRLRPRVYALGHNMFESKIEKIKSEDRKSLGVTETTTVTRDDYVLIRAGRAVPEDWTFAATTTRRSRIAIKLYRAHNDRGIVYAYVCTAV